MLIDLNVRCYGMCGWYNASQRYCSKYRNTPSSWTVENCCQRGGGCD